MTQWLLRIIYCSDKSAFEFIFFYYHRVQNRYCTPQYWLLNKNKKTSAGLNMADFFGLLILGRPETVRE